MSTSEPGAPAPAIAATTFSTRTTVTDASGPLQLVQIYVEFPVGAASPPQRANGAGLVSVIEGEVTLTIAGSETRLGARQSTTDRTGQVHEARNTGSGPAKVVATYLVPEGIAPLSLVGAAPQIAPPRTGDAGLRQGEADALPVIFTVIMLVAAALIMRRAFRGI